MWNSITESEVNLDIKTNHCHGGIAPLRQDLALHTYQQKKQMHAEMSRRTDFWRSIQTGIAKIAVQIVPGYGHSAVTMFLSRRTSGRGN